MSEFSTEELGKQAASTAPMKPTEHPTYQENEVIDVKFLVVEILRRWWLVALFGGFGVWSGIMDMHAFAPSYQAIMLVSPVDDDVLSAPAGRGGASASVVGALTGINLSVGKHLTKLDRLVHKVSTIKLAKKLDQEHGLMGKIFGGKWDGHKRSWDRPQGMRFELRERVNSYLNIQTWSEPTIENLSSFLQGSFKVEDVADTPYKKLTFSHAVPEKALYFLNLIFSGADYEIREEDRLESTRRRKYLDSRMRSTEVIEFKSTLVSLLAEEERREIMAQGGFQRIVKVLDSAYVSKYRTSPTMIRYVGVPAVLGMTLAVGIILIIVLIRKE
jgi:hypothetical protein